jgi:hypothetical protein
MPKKKEMVEVTVSEVVDYLRIKGDFARGFQEMAARKIAAEAAKREGLKISKKELQSAADDFRIALGLNKARDTERWFRFNGISIESYEQYLETSLLINKYKDKLDKKTDKKKYMSSPEIRQEVRERIFEDWLADRLV